MPRSATVLRPAAFVAAAATALAGAPGHAAAPAYYRANSAARPVYAPCVTVCYSGENLYDVAPQEWRMVATSRDGRFTTFYAQEQPGPTVGAVPYQLWLFDRTTGKVELASRALDGSAPAEGINYSKGFGITADGRYSWFLSDAPNLVPNDRNKSLDFFAYDRIAKRVVRLSLNVKGQEIAGASIGTMSADGSTVMFMSSGDVLRKGVTQTLLYWKNLRTGKAGVVVDEKGEPHSASSNSPQYMLSPNGRYLLDTDDAGHAAVPYNGTAKMYGIYDLWTHRTQYLTGASEDALTGRASMDAAATSIVFDTRAAGLTRVDLTTGAVQRVADLAPTLVHPTHPTLTDDGKTMVVMAQAAAGADPTQASGGLYAIPIGKDGKGGTPRLITALPAAGSCLAADCARHLFASPVVSADGHAVAFLTDEAFVAENPANGWDAYVVTF